MTLIIARRDAETKKVFFVGDSRRFFRESYKAEDPYDLKLDNGVFKFYRDSNLIIAYAGLILEAEKLLQQIHSLQLKSEEVITFLEKNQFETEYLVSFIKSDQVSDLYEIKKNVARKVEVGWIGNKDAFNEFQKKFAREGTYLSFVHKMKTCLEQVIHSRKFIDVGGLVVVVYQFETSFSFETGASSTGFNFVYNQIGQYWGIGPGSAEQGTFTFESCDFEDLNLIYYYFHQPHLLIMYKAENGLIKCISNSVYASHAVVEQEISKFLGYKFKLQYSFG